MLSLDGKNFYEMFQLSRAASTEQIREAYRDIARVFHPDSNFYDEVAELPLSEEHTGVFKSLTDAYNTLINPERRKQYDKSLPPELPKWEADEEVLAEIDLSKLKGRDPRSRKPSGSYAMGRFGVVNQDYQRAFDPKRSSTILKATPVAEIVRRERTRHSDRRIVQMSIGLSAFVVVLTLVVLTVA